MGHLSPQLRRVASPLKEGPGAGAARAPCVSLPFRPGGWEQPSSPTHSPGLPQPPRFERWAQTFFHSPAQITRMCVHPKPGPWAETPSLEFFYLEPVEIVFSPVTRSCLSVCLGNRQPGLLAQRKKPVRQEAQKGPNIPVALRLVPPMPSPVLRAIGSHLFSSLNYSDWIFIICNERVLDNTVWTDRNIIVNKPNTRGHYGRYRQHTEPYLGVERASCRRGC